MQINWAMLVVVAVVAAAATVTVVLLVAFALVGLSARSGRRVGGAAIASRARSDAGTALAALCLLAAGLVVGYGLYLIIV